MHYALLHGTYTTSKVKQSFVSRTFFIRKSQRKFKKDEQIFVFFFNKMKTASKGSKREKSTRSPLIKMCFLAAIRPHNFHNTSLRLLKKK